MPTNRAVFAAVVSAIREQTSVLLGTTIGFSEEDWAAPTALTGWTRSHIAAHLVQGAEALTRVVESSALGFTRRLYASEADKRLAIEVGALATGLDLQIGLDTSAGALQLVLPSVEADEREVALRAGLKMPAHDLPLARLSEVTLHHFDLGGPGPSGLDPAVAVELLRFEVGRIGEREDIAPARLIADEGFDRFVGRPGKAIEVRGPAADLVIWLTRGLASPRVSRSDP